LKIEKKIGMKNVLQQRLNVSFKQRRHWDCCRLACISKYTKAQEPEKVFFT
jgi:hypothetical protein